MIRINRTSKVLVFGFMATAVLSSNPSLASVPGKSCPKVGATMTISGHHYLCVKKTGKMIWKSVSKVQTTQEAAPTPTKQVTPPTPVVSCSSTQLNAADQYIANRNDLIDLYSLQLSSDNNAMRQAAASGNYLSSTLWNQSVLRDQSNIASANSQINSVRQFIQGNCTDESLIAGL